ncbi:MAG: hypothetical protein RL297_1407 [Pseudomonadota bacterium]
MRALPHPAAPPPKGSWGVPMALAMGVHALLALALTWGVAWKDRPAPVFEAELWSALPETGAPAAPVLPKPPEPEPAPEAPVEAEPEPQKKAETPPPSPPAPKPPDIALEKAQQAQAQQAALKRKKDAEEQAAKAKQAQEAQRIEQQRQAQIQRMMGQAGAQNQAKGTASQASGPSAGYAARVAARIKPNVVLTDPVLGNPRAEVEVTTLADGTIIARRLVKPSGNPQWDQAVLRAIDRTGSLPKDVDGRIPSPLIIGLRPLD